MSDYPPNQPPEFPQQPYQPPPPYYQQPPQQPKQSGISSGFKFVIGGCLALFVISGAIMIGCSVMVGGLAGLGKKAQEKSMSTPSLSNPGNAPSSGTPSDSSSVFKTKWIAQSDTSAMDSSQGYAMALQAENEVKGWVNNATPVLFIRCKENKVDLYVNTDMSSSVEYGGGHTVRLRLDEAQPVKETWADSEDNKALFSRNAIALAKKIVKAQTFKFEFVPFNGSPQIAVFDVRGAEPFLDKLLSVCKKK